MNRDSSRHATPSPWRRARRRLFHILEAGRNDDVLARVFEWSMSALIVANIVAFALETIPDYHARYGAFFTRFNTISLVVFFVEYVLRMWVVIEHPHVHNDGPLLGRLRFALRPAMLVDLIVILPLFLVGLGETDARVLRFFRVVRFLKLARYSPALATLGRVVFAERRALFGTVLILVGASTISASLMYFVEGRVQPDKFGTVPDAMWWAIATLTTVGYGDVTPITAFGRLVAACTMVVGLGLFALPVGILSNGYINEIRRRDFVVTWGMLARVPLFAHLDAAEMGDILQVLRARTVQPGEEIALAGEDVEGLIIVASGSIEVGEGEGVRKLGAGDFIGEQSLLRRTQHDATATALSRADLLVLDASDFAVAMKRRAGLRAKVAQALDRYAGTPRS